MPTSCGNANCTNGQIFDIGTRRRIPCPVCVKERASEVDTLSKTEKGASLPATWGFNEKYLSRRFSWSNVIPESEVAFLDRERYSEVGDALTAIYQNLLSGELPHGSVCIGLGVKGSIERFAYPVMATAYIQGISVAPPIGVRAFAHRSFEDPDGDWIDEYYTSQLAVMIITEGCMKSDLQTAKGFMQERALRGWPTIFVTTWSVEACSLLLTSPDDISAYRATAQFVKYAHSDSEKGSYIGNITGVSQERVGASAPAPSRRRPAAAGDDRRQTVVSL